MIVPSIPNISIMAGRLLEDCVHFHNLCVNTHVRLWPKLQGWRPWLRQ